MTIKMNNHHAPMMMTNAGWTFSALIVSQLTTSALKLHSVIYLDYHFPIAQRMIKHVGMHGQLTSKTMVTNNLTKETSE